MFRLKYKSHRHVNFQYQFKIIIRILLLLLLLIYLLTAIDFSLGGSSPCTSTDKTNKNKYTLAKQYKNTVNTSTHITKSST
jgi:hypothetical protein